MKSGSSPILAASNVRFFLALKRDGDAQVTSEGDLNTDHDIRKYEQVFEDRGLVVLENKESLPRSYMTERVIKTTDRKTFGIILKKFQLDRISLFHGPDGS